MKKFIFSLIFISLISLQVFAFQGSDKLEIIRKKTALRLVRNDHHNSERIKIPDPFQFDHNKREKTTVKSYPTESGNRDLMDVKINGEDQATIVQGDDFVVTIYFSDGCSEANVSMWADMNGNEIWEDDIDLLVPDMQDEIMDNDLDDEDPTVGVYQMTFYGDEDGPNRVSNLGCFFVAEDAGGIDDAFLWIDPITSDYSVSGLVTPAAPNVIIAAMSSEENMWMTATDASGNYQNFVPVVTDYMVMAFDPIGVLGGGMFPDTVYVDVNINGHITGYNFNFIPGNANIEGTVLDENGAPLVGVTVYAEGQMPGGVTTETNSSGYYNLTVIEGWWEVGFNWDDLIPDYLPVEEVEVYVEEGGTETVDFLIYETDSTIEGTVYLDDIPAAGFEIDSWSEIGMTETDSEQGGSYVLHVASEADAMGGYSVNVDIWDIPDVYVVESYNNIMSGSTGIDFHIYTVTGGVEGHIYDSVTLEPAEDCWVNAFDGTNWFGTGTDDEGYYQLPLPNGTYEISAQGEMYYLQTVPDVVIEDEMITMDFYLNPISFDGALEGYAYVEGTTDPIEGVDIWVYSDTYFTGTCTNEFGFYHLDLPNGVYVFDAWHVSYYNVHIDDIFIENNIVQQNFEMEPVIFDGSLSGYVYEEGTTNPIINANISVGTQGYWNMTYSDGTGYYYFDLPNGIYSLDCWKDGYLGFHEDNIIINDDNVVFDIYLVPDVNSDNELILPASSLSQNYPNPFNPETTISFTTENTENTKLIIFNIKGQKVRTLINEEFPAGRHSVLWDGRDDKCEPVSSGLYFFKLETGTFSSVKKMILIK
ncbi:MAG: T9SS type A sorting domain-containing protein [Candidatus Cloacimonetes bacterium]|nr:T9SS type A sorting domain-containing protein [Candidatus Cloacimonadota bacterium]MBL7148894.1 T9SS type A sorting domain-containing protein [Candidatus Cloacimonadota bacterium]